MYYSIIVLLLIINMNKILKNPYIAIIVENQGCYTCSLCGKDFESERLSDPQERLIGMDINIYTYHNKIICGKCFINCNNKCEICNENIEEDSKFLYHLVSHFIDLLKQSKQSNQKILHSIKESYDVWYKELDEENIYNLLDRHTELVKWWNIKSIVSN